MKHLKVKEAGLRSSIKRLIDKKRLIFLKQGLYLIVPIEYREMGAPPPDWYIDSLMKAHNSNYYVGLLTAAAIHGAAHQQPQVFQVITDKQMRPAKIGRVRIEFCFKKDLSSIPVKQRKTTTGYMRVSTPEVTAFDLVKYLKQSGHINHISTVFSELGDAVDPQALAKVAILFPLVCRQRVGYILDYVGFQRKTQELLIVVNNHHPQYFPLRPDKKWEIKDKDSKWHLFINEKLEPDL